MSFTPPFYRFILLIISIGLTPGCATLFNSEVQYVEIRKSNASIDYPTQVKLSYGKKEYHADLPVTIGIRSSHKNLHAWIEDSCNKSAPVPVTKKIDYTYWFNFLSPMGFLIDPLTGRWFEYDKVLFVPNSNTQPCAPPLGVTPNALENRAILVDNRLYLDFSFGFMLESGIDYDGTDEGYWGAEFGVKRGGYIVEFKTRSDSVPLFGGSYLNVSSLSFGKQFETQIERLKFSTNIGIAKVSYEVEDGLGPLIVGAIFGMNNEERQQHLQELEDEYETSSSGPMLGLAAEVNVFKYMYLKFYADKIFDGELDPDFYGIGFIFGNR